MLFSDFFASDVMMQALLPALLIGAVASTVSVMVLAHRLSFIVVGVSHATLAGLGLAAFLALPLMPTATVVAVGVSLLLAMSGRQQLAIIGEAGSGILFAVAMAVGVVLVSLSDRSSVDLFGILFGSILTIPPEDYGWLYGVALLVLASMLVAARIWWSIGFDADTVAAQGIPVQGYRMALHTVAGVTVILCVKLAGIILTTGLMILPAASAWFWGRTLWSLWLLSLLSGWLAVFVGLLCSWLWDWPAGATVVLMQGAIFFISWGISWITQRERKGSQLPS